MPARDLQSAYHAAVTAIEQVEDPEEAFRQASTLRETADGMVGSAAALRARMAYRVMQSTSMSLSQLAERLGTSKARADQLIRAAKSELGE